MLSVGNNFFYTKSLHLDKYAELLGAYCEILGRLPFAERASQLTAEIAHLRAEAKQAVDQASKREKKKVQAECDKKNRRVGRNLDRRHRSQLAL